MKKHPPGFDVRTEVVNLKMTKAPPDDYHCRCRFCSEGFKGVLVRKDGTPYSRLDRNAYYSKAERIKTGDEKKGNEKEGGHVAKTPLHAARWAVQAFSKPGGWVLDPTMGAGTTAVEALNHGRNAFGVELQSIEVIRENVAVNNPHGMKFHVEHGDARFLAEIMEDKLPDDLLFDLVINNPPYSGDERAQTNSKLGADPRDANGKSMKIYTVGYDRSLPNLAFLKEGKEYWDTMATIYAAACDRLASGGHFVVGVKDQMRNKVADELHRKFAEVLEAIPGMRFEGMVALPHYPTTLFMNTYPKWHPGTRVPMHQSIVVFRKDLGWNS